MLKTLVRLFRRRADTGTPTDISTDERDSVELEALLAAPIAALEAGELHKALAQLETLIEEHAACARAHYLLGTIFYRDKKIDDARDSFLLASAYQPQWWAPHFQLGVLALDASKFDIAAESLRKAIELGARDGRVHNALGAAYLHLSKPDEAADEFRTALELKPDLPEALTNLGYLLTTTLEQPDEGARCIERALELAPEDRGVLSNWLLVLVRRGEREKALQLADELLACDPTLAEARTNRAVLLLERGEFGAGWPDYESRKQVNKNRCTSDFPAPEWDGSPLRDRTIFVYAEQGLGDQIMFASCIPDLLSLARACVIECDPKLEAIFRRSFPTAHVVTQHAWRTASLGIQNTPDYKVAIGSLPLFFRRGRAEFPSHEGYLQADPERITDWRTRLQALPGRRKIGISWRGGLPTTRRSIRSVPLDDWLPILSLPDIDFVNLQYGDTEEERAALRSSTDVAVHHFDEAIQDYDETAALVGALDLILSVQTAVVHLAGALGKRTWALIPSIPEWRYGAEGATMIWYPSVELIRQQQFGDWSAVINKVRERLASED